MFIENVLKSNSEPRACTVAPLGRDGHNSGKRESGNGGSGGGGGVQTVLWRNCMNVWCPLEQWLYAQFAVLTQFSQRKPGPALIKGRQRGLADAKYRVRESSIFLSLVQLPLCTRKMLENTRAFGPANSYSKLSSRNVYFFNAPNISFTTYRL